MGGREETGFVGAWGKVDAILEGVLEERLEVVGRARDGVVVVAHGGFCKEEGEHGAGLRDLKGEAFFFGGGAEGFSDAAAFGVEFGERVDRFEFVEGSEAGGHREGISGKGAGLINRAERSEVLHDVAPATKSADGEAATDDFTHCGEVGAEVFN